jgi:hypothetical protein
MATQTTTPSKAAALLKRATQLASQGAAGAQKVLNRYNAATGSNLSLTDVAASGANVISNAAGRLTGVVTNSPANGPASAVLSPATGGRVQGPAQIVQYVGQDPSRLQIAMEAAARGGVDISPVVTADLLQTYPQFAGVVQQARGYATALASQAGRTSDATLGTKGDVNDAARDILRRDRVEAVLAVFGSWARYTLCVPIGGVPVEDYTWYTTVFRRGRR